jgi:citrate synthase
MTTTNASRTVADAMTIPAITAYRDETLETVAQRMHEHGVGSVVITEANRPVGILTERDLLRAAAGGAKPAAAAAGDWMTLDPQCVSPDVTIDEAWERLATHRYRHIPVVTGGELKGIVSMRDLMALAQLRPAAAPPVIAPRGLKGVVVAETALGDVRGLEGFYHYRQYSATELAEKRSFEDVWHLLIDGDLPSAAERADFVAEVNPLRALPEALLDLLPVVARAHAAPLAGLRTGISHLAAVEHMPASLDADRTRLRADALRLSAAVPTIITALHRLGQGLEPIAPRDDLGYVANYLWMLTGTEPDRAHARAVEQYMILAVDHGFNASTFTTRVVTSTGADLGAAICAGIGALSGPLHGGAPSRALDSLDAIGTPDRAEAWIRRAVQNGERIMGFGHPVYRTTDPRSTLLRSIAESFGGPLVDFAEKVEETVERVLAELKPGRELHTNVEFYAGVVMELCGLPRDLFTPTFAASRVIGWCAQALEQAADNRIIRPSSRYVGPPPPQPVPAA